eukprot:gene4590-4804_t
MPSLILALAISALADVAAPDPGIEQGATMPQTIEYWRRRSEAEPTDYSAVSCLGVVLLRNQEMDVAMATLHRAVKGDPDDRVAWEYLGGAYGMAARRLASAGADPRRALEAAVRAFRAADKGRAAVSKGGCQLDLAQPQTLVLRGWGDAEAWLGRHDEAGQVFAKGVSSGLWESRWCRPNEELSTWVKPKPFFLPIGLFGHVTRPLVAELGVIKEELQHSVDLGLPVQHGWAKESGGLHSSQTWLQLPLVVDGVRRTPPCSAWPATCTAMDRLLAAVPALSLRDGQIKVSLMHPGTHVRPHAGPTNARLRMHCPLLLPAGGPRDMWFRVGTERRQWKHDECLVFDESCEHEVEVGAGLASVRAVLIIDFANPTLADKDLYQAALHAPASWPGARAGFAASAAEEYAKFRHHWADLHTEVDL